MSESTSEACLKAAWQALLRGDCTERDRLCERAKILLDAENKAAAVERVMAIDFYVRPNGVCVSTKAMARAVGVLN